MYDDEGAFWFILTLGMVAGIIATVLVQLSAGVYDKPSYDDENGDECIILDEDNELILHPEYGEDDGAIYCPTGAASVSQLGRVVE